MFWTVCDLHIIHMYWISFGSLVVDRLDNIGAFADSIGPRWISPFPPWLSVLASIWTANLGTGIWSRRRERNQSKMRGIFNYRDPSLLPAFSLLTEASCEMTSSEMSARRSSEKRWYVMERMYLGTDSEGFLEGAKMASGLGEYVEISPTPQ